MCQFCVEVEDQTHFQSEIYVLRNFEVNAHIYNTQQ
jgi:hypothetical protein